MRTPVVAANWKMNTTIDEAKKLVLDMKKDLMKLKNIEVVLCPPFVSLETVRNLIQDTSIKIGAQNMHFELKGAFTGEISPTMINNICQYVIIGHSERRQYFKETDYIVNKKIKAAISNGLISIVCVGENIDQKNSNQTNEVLMNQIQESLRDIGPRSDIVIAYEPLWAIGTGKAAYGEEANKTIAFIRNIIKEYWDDNAAQDIRMLYGGSVKSKNILDFTSKTDIDGVLVGGASLNAEEFVSIARQSVSQQ